MSGLALLFLLLHIGGAIVAFGPTFAFPIIGDMGGAEPTHGNFALRVNERISTRIVIPLVILQGITGVALIWTLPVDLTKAAWLDVGIVLYVITIAILLGWQQPALRQLIAATRNLPSPMPSTERPESETPLPHVAALIRRVQVGGISLAFLIVVIIVLMVLGSHGFFV